MKARIEDLINALSEYTDGRISLAEVEEQYVSPIIVGDSYDDLPTDVNEAIYALDMWELNDLTQLDVLDIIKTLKQYTRKI